MACRARGESPATYKRSWIRSLESIGLRSPDGFGVNQGVKRATDVPSLDLRTALRPLGRALDAHARGGGRRTLSVHSDAGEVQRMPVALFFRSGARLTVADRRALALCRGRVLDVGAGAGALALALQDVGAE